METRTRLEALGLKEPNAVHLGVVGLLVLLLLIPLGMVRSVVEERHERYQGVVSEIAGAWSGPQTLVGPVLVVPLTVKRAVEVSGVGEGRGPRWTLTRKMAVLLPDSLDVRADVTPESRRRGIYRVEVYTARVALSASLGDLRRRVARLTAGEESVTVHWDRTTLSLGLSEPRGMVAVDRAQVDGATLQAHPGTASGGVLDRGFHLRVGRPEADRITAEITFRVRGSRDFAVAPVAAGTGIHVRSPWPSPSFGGGVLPVSTRIGPDGFAASWEVSELSRSFPQEFLAGDSPELRELTAAVRLFTPMGLYAKVTRAVKYGVLFIALTYLTVGLIELSTGHRVSEIQYLLVGAALALFFLLLLALAEHVGFGPAYLVAAATVIGLNTAYCRAWLPRAGLAWVVGAVLTCTYGVLYTILRAEDYALLSGSLVLVAALAAAMWLTRRLHRSPASPTGT